MVSARESARAPHAQVTISEESESASVHASVFERRSADSRLVFCAVLSAVCLIASWLLFNDARVNIVSAEKVLESQAYMLFYKRKDKTALAAAAATNSA